MEGNQISTITRFAAPKKSFDGMFKKKKVIDLDKENAMALFGLRGK